MEEKIRAMVTALAVMGIVTAIGYAGRGEEKGQGEKIVALVNGEKITEEALTQRLFSQFGKNTLERMINEILISQEARKKRVKISKKEAEKRLEVEKSSFPDPQAFQEMLERSGISLEEVERQIASQLLIEKMIARRIKITRKEMRDYFEKNKHRLGQPEKIKLSHILVKTEEEAKEIKKELDQGARFSKLAGERSIDNFTKEDGGDLGFSEVRLLRLQFGLSFQKAALALEQGGISAPVNTSLGYHIIWLRDKKRARVASGILR